jgi:hypothetical protein
MTVVVLEELCSRSPRPKVSRPKSGPAFIGDEVLTSSDCWGISFRTIESGKPKEDAHIRSLDGRSRGK